MKFIDILKEYNDCDNKIRSITLSLENQSDPYVIEVLEAEIKKLKSRQEEIKNHDVIVPLKNDSMPHLK